MLVTITQLRRFFIYTSIALIVVGIFGTIAILFIPLKKWVVMVFFFAEVYGSNIVFLNFCGVIYRYDYLSWKKKQHNFKKNRVVIRRMRKLNARGWELKDYWKFYKFWIKSIPIYLLLFTYGICLFLTAIYGSCLWPPNTWVWYMSETVWDYKVQHGTAIIPEYLIDYLD